MWNKKYFWPALVVGVPQVCFCPCQSALWTPWFRDAQFPLSIGSAGEDTHNRQVSNKRRTLAGNSIVDHSDVVGAPPVGAAPTTSSFST